MFVLELIGLDKFVSKMFSPDKIVCFGVIVGFGRLPMGSSEE